ncbi:hypothetical protein DPMN_046937 [Dreissena polymorpha]|uniref:Uncharacterized protein n=1 Tax=Dreissena polymorpha TaxID=45954 RepID=A0A9D4D7T4_DREPO|nr:hypothetical protein DPMN_046937 [Dreissena polymorpha]
MCVPEFLWCEMYRGNIGTSNSSGCMLPFDGMYDCICLQIEPYLYYLQYLTYRELNQEPKPLETSKKLSKFTEIMKSARFKSSKGEAFVSCGHLDTSLNMLGHCYELEQKWESARKSYETSLRMQPQRNAAVLHITRLQTTLPQTRRNTDGD